MGKPTFSWKQKRQHYTDVASVAEPVKSGSKFSEDEQKAYARGQRDARNEANRITAHKNSTAEQRAAYKARKAAERAAYKASKEAEKTAKKSRKKK